MSAGAPPDHDTPRRGSSVPEPLTPVAPARRRSAAEEARTLVAGTATGTLATSSRGHPWASFVAYATLGDGSPVLCVSTLAEHGRNLAADGRASLLVTETDHEGDPLDMGRVTLAGVAEQPAGAEATAARDAYVAAVESARHYVDFGDFALWVLRVERVRWVGGYGRMDSADAAAYRDAEPDPVARAAPSAVAHLNADHADALLSMARALAGHPDATAALCRGADRYGLDLWVSSPRGEGPARVGFAEAVTDPGGLRGATVELARRARAT